MWLFASHFLADIILYLLIIMPIIFAYNICPYFCFSWWTINYNNDEPVSLSLSQPHWISCFSDRKAQKRTHTMWQQCGTGLCENDNNVLKKYTACGIMYTCIIITVTLSVHSKEQCCVVLSHWQTVWLCGLYTQSLSCTSRLQADTRNCPGTKKGCCLRLIFWNTSTYVHCSCFWLPFTAHRSSL